VNQAEPTLQQRGGARYGADMLAWEMARTPSLWLLVGLLAGGCGRTEGPAAGAREAGVPADGGGSDAGGAPMSGPSIWLEAFCGYQQACCQQAGVRSSRMGCFRSFSSPELGNGSITVDPAKLPPCLAAIKQPVTCSDAGRAAVSLCAAALVGTVPEGQPCRTPGQCAKDGNLVLCARSEDSGGTGRVCRRSLPAALGQPCSVTKALGSTISIDATAPAASHAHCSWDEGLYCRRDTAVCTAVKALGEACDDYFECGPAAFCEGTCRPTRANGTACKSWLECASHLCGGGDVCTGFDQRSCQL
jgi:hypothetical protein